MNNKTLVRNLIEDVFNRRDLSRLSTYCAEDCVCHVSLASTKNIAELRRVYEGYHIAFSDIRCVLDTQVAEGDLVATRLSAVATNTGVFLGRPATGKKVQLAGIQVDRVQAGRIAESWVQMDYLSMLQQLDTLPRPQAALQPARMPSPQRYQPNEW